MLREPKLSNFSKRKDTHNTVNWLRSNLQKAKLQRRKKLLTKKTRNKKEKQHPVPNNTITCWACLCGTWAMKRFNKSKGNAKRSKTSFIFWRRLLSSNYGLKICSNFWKCLTKFSRNNKNKDWRMNNLSRGTEKVKKPGKKLKKREVKIKSRLIRRKLSTGILIHMMVKLKLRKRGLLKFLKILKKQRVFLKRQRK